MAPAASDAVARFATEAERSEWDALVAANPGGGEVWMGDAYLGVKRREGRYRDRRVIVERTAAPPVAVGVLAKRVPLLGEWWHLPAGPAGEDPEAVLAVSAAVAALARRSGAFLLKIEPRLAPAARPAIRAAGYRETVRIIPNPSTVLVDVATEAAPGTPEADRELLAGLGKKARNAITRAARDGIVASRVPATEENCAAFVRLLQETAEGRFVLRSERYYREFWQSFSRSGDGQLFLAHRPDADGAPVLVAGAFAMGLGAKTTYKDGASVRAKTAYGASHALQWEVLRWANARGATVHDLCGAPPSDRADDREHPLFGVGQFKRSFQPVITDYAGAYDLPLRRRAYALWTRLGDRIARRASLALQKDPYY
ncbi:peptidoglycan bridge formation glycyltransferase FemA/FemB family protein [Leucobacter allii]|uniref:Peptidoglycan bridge formation glycyltransferase FemA/FemB family protein n=1 Tax=Leucobacter allii TaxID=2932247 RepID=A0ABY4FPK1_9MICO|nr:peptidoglycan bridge formation glycyltransferase FemA/FemB family protein [Leucobacter allii]UOQ58219.1 peptidoglycan bridge formation glycyltransferase FemA/FemB family protein [Leucobacter allii]